MRYNSTIITIVIRGYVNITINCIVVLFLQIFGGAGYNCEYPVEKLMRDAKIFQVILIFTDIILPCLKSVKQLYCWLCCLPIEEYV